MTAPEWPLDRLARGCAASSRQNGDAEDYDAVRVVAYFADVYGIDLLDPSVADGLFAGLAHAQRLDGAVCADCGRSALDVAAAHVACLIADRERANR